MGARQAIRTIIRSASAALLVGTAVQPAIACTGIRLKADDGSIVQARA